MAPSGRQEIVCWARALSTVRGDAFVTPSASVRFKDMVGVGNRPHGGLEWMRTMGSLSVERPASLSSRVAVCIKDCIFRRAQPLQMSVFVRQGSPGEVLLYFSYDDKITLFLLRCRGATFAIISAAATGLVRKVPHMSHNDWFCTRLVFRGPF